MSGYTMDQRSHEQRVAELSWLARRRRLPEPMDGCRTWADLLFDGANWRDPSEPSQALMDTLVERHRELAEHLNRLPTKVAEWYFRSRLGIEPAPAEPDRVVVVAQGDPKKLPVVVGRGSVLKAGKRTGGKGDRLYRTDDALTIVGATIGQVRSYYCDPAGPTDRQAEWPDRSAPFSPFDKSHPAATHEIYFEHDVLAMRPGPAPGMIYVLQDGSSVLDADYDWSTSHPDGDRFYRPGGDNGPTTTPAAAGSADQVRQEQPATGFEVSPANPGTSCYLRVGIVPGTLTRTKLNLVLDDVRLEVQRYVQPDVVLANNSVVDISQRFEPFAANARPGATFAIGSNEAFAKPLAGLDVGYDYTPDSHEGDPIVAWERWKDGSPVTLGKGALAQSPRFSLGGPGESRRAFSEEAKLGDHAGRFVRATLDSGDFGWSEYEHRLRQLLVKAAGVANGKEKTAESEGADAAGTSDGSSLGSPEYAPETRLEPDGEETAESSVEALAVSATDLEAPRAPTATNLFLDYTTAPVAPAIRTRNGFVERHFPPDSREAITPFVVQSRGGVATGYLELGIGMGSAYLGQGLSLFIDIDPANACDPQVGRELEGWEVLVNGLWKSIDVIDGTSGLRQSGIVRLITPGDWTSEIVDDVEIRWLRFVSTDPDAVGTISEIVPDAVMATYHLAELDLKTDDTPATPIEPQTIKGPRDAIDGLKKATNPLPSWGGRAPETGVLERAPHLVRSRNRLVNTWDYETFIGDRFSEVAVARCLPHTDASGSPAPGSVGLVIVPNTADPAPNPSVRLAERIERELRPHMPVHAEPVVLCPDYQLISVDARIVLRRGEAAAEMLSALSERLDRWLHPIAAGPIVFGRAFFRSSVVGFLEDQAEVDHVERLVLASHPGADRVALDPDRGLIASSGVHRLQLTETL